MPEAGHMNAGDPLPDVFPPDDPLARFVVSMAMAANDIDRALRDVLRAGDNDDPDFSYRVRLSVGHLVEALDALRSYTQEFPEVLTLIDRASSEDQRHLSRARGSLQKAGHGVLANVRNNTFHYPSPDRRYKPPSDEQLRDALAALPERGTSVRLNTESRALTYTFADDLAMAMTLGKTATTSADLMHQAGVALLTARSRSYGGSVRCTGHTTKREVTASATLFLGRSRTDPEPHEHVAGQPRSLGPCGNRCAASLRSWRTNLVAELRGGCSAPQREPQRGHPLSAPSGIAAANPGQARRGEAIQGAQPLP